MKKLLFILFSTAMISSQAQSSKLNPNVFEYEQGVSVYSLSPFNLKSNNLSSINIDFGTAANFMLFTGVGAVANTGVSTITGNVGSNAGAIAGFGAPSVLNGVIENSNELSNEDFAALLNNEITNENDFALTDLSNGAIEDYIIYSNSTSLLNENY